jgi:hypothetical protein
MPHRIYSLEDYRNALDGNGPLAKLWNENPRTLVVDLIFELEEISSKWQKAANRKINIDWSLWQSKKDGKRQKKSQELKCRFK